MSNTTTTKPKPKEIQKIEVDEDLLEKALTETDLEKQVIVHCFLKTGHEEMLIRIWNSTYLRDQDSAHKSKLVTSHNITIYPTWLIIRGNARFTLVFSALPKSCTSFDLFEDIPEGNGFFTGLISRNKTDVYSVEIYS